MIEQLASITPTADELDRLTLVLVKELLAGGRDDRRALVEQWRTACGTGGLPASVLTGDVSSKGTRVDKPPVAPDSAGTVSGTGGMSSGVRAGDVNSTTTRVDKPPVAPDSAGTAVAHVDDGNKVAK